MRALLLAAGLGTRLRPLTFTVPKCLVPIRGRPLIDYWLDLLAAGGIEEMLVNLHYLPEQVRAHLRHSPHARLVRTVYEEKLLGTGGTLLKNREFFRGRAGMLIHADNLSHFDVHGFIRAFEERPPGVALTMMTFRTAAPRECGIVEVDGRGVVHAFHEKVANPPGDQANAAVYIFSPAVVDFVAGLGKDVIDFSTEVIPHFLGRMNIWFNGVYHRDIGNTESLAAAQREFSSWR